MSVTPGRPPYTTEHFDLPIPGGEDDADYLTDTRALADAIDTVLKDLADQIGSGNGGNGGGSSDYELIEHRVLTANAQSVTFADIPQTFSHLRLLASTRSTGDPGELVPVDSNMWLLSMRFNNLGGASYHVNYMRNVHPGTAASRSIFGSAWAHIGMVGPQAATVVDILNYTAPDLLRYSSQSGMFNGTGTTYSMAVAGVVESWIGAVNAIQVSTLGGWPQENMLPGSRLSLYGLR